MKVGEKMDSLLNLPRPEPFGNDWRDGDGILRCGVCGEPKEAYIETIGRIQPVTCSCDKRKREDAEKKEAVTRAIELLHRSPLYDPSFDGYSLRDDDSPNSEAGRLVRAYIEKWEKMRDASCGLMFSGPCGTGKTFYCAGICNALRKQGVKTIMFPAARFIMAMRGNDAQEVIDSFWGILKRERYYGKRFTSKQALIQMIQSNIRYYNTRRVQRNLGVLTPLEKHNSYLAA